MGTKSAWTPERRARQANKIRDTRPWEKSTGPRTEQGKRISAQNARMKSARAALHGIRKYGVIQRRYLLLVRKISGTAILYRSGKLTFPSGDFEGEIVRLQEDMNYLMVGILALLDGNDASVQADLETLANCLAIDEISRKSD